MGGQAGMWHAAADVSRRLEDTIRELCNRAIGAKDTREVTAICSELRAAMNEYVRRLRSRAVSHELPSERRSATDGASPSQDGSDSKAKM